MSKANDTTTSVSLILNFADNSGNDIQLTIPESDPDQISTRATAASVTPDAFVRARMTEITNTGKLKNTKGDTATVVVGYYFKRTTTTPLS